MQLKQRQEEVATAMRHVGVQYSTVRKRVDVDVRVSVSVQCLPGKSGLLASISARMHLRENGTHVRHSATRRRECECERARRGTPSGLMTSAPTRCCMGQSCQVPV